MAMYLRDANSVTAVTAFLAQFKVAATGAITFVSGVDTFHVWWLHRALQKIAWDFTITGDDEINLAKPNPSTSEAIGTIITLKDWTTDFSVSYTITDEVATYLFGGSVEQGATGSVTRYSGLIVLGSVNSATSLQVIQNGVLLTSHWGTGKNQIDTSTLMSIMVKTHAAGVEIDNSVVLVKGNTWGDTFAIWQTTLGLGEKVAAINTFSDPQNTTLQATVEAYTITKSQGYKLINVDTLGDKPFIGEWSYGAYDKKALHEFTKSLLVFGSLVTLYGIDGDLWTGRLYDCAITPATGTWTEGETPNTLTWGTGATAGTGTLVGVDDTDATLTTRLILHLTTGVPPADTMLITGSGTGDGTVSGTPATITTNPNLLGVFTGTAWIGAYGMGFVAGELGSSDSVTDLDGNVLSPPNNVAIQVVVEVGNVADDPHVLLARKDPVLNAPDYTTLTLGTGNNSTDPTLVVTEVIAADTPQDGWVLVLDTSGGATSYFAYHYSSWAVSTFTLDATDHPTGLAANYTSGDPVFTAIFYTSAVGGTTSKLASNSLIHSTNFDVVGWVRHGDPATPDKPVPISGTVGPSGLSLTVVLDDEA